MKWFRFYHEALHDAKVQTLSADLFKAWINILCLASEAEDRGILPPVPQIAFSLRIKEDKAKQIIGQLSKAGLIDEDENGVLRPHNWDSRQPSSDDVNYRVREHRRRKANVTETTEDVSRPQNVTLHVTGVKRDVTERLEERRLEEKRTDPLPPTGGGVCVSINGAEPIPIEALPLKAIPEVDSAELTRVGERAERLFPMMDFGIKIRGIAGDFSLATIDAALSELHASNVKNWKYLIGIAKRIEAQGGPQKAHHGSPVAPLFVEPTETPEQKAARQARLAEGMKAHMAQLAQEGRRAPRQ